MGEYLKLSSNFWVVFPLPNLVPLEQLCIGLQMNMKIHGP